MPTISGATNAPHSFHLGRSGPQKRTKPFPCCGDGPAQLARRHYILLPAVRQMQTPVMGRLSICISGKIKERAICVARSFLLAVSVSAGL